MKLVENIFHYYGDIVRKLFLAGAIIMLLTLPVLNPLLPLPIFDSLLTIIILSLVAGLTSPRKKWTLFVNEIIAIGAVIAFEYYAVNYYIAYSAESTIFLVNQLLAVIFLFALYYNTKTIRGMISGDSRFKEES